MMNHSVLFETGLFAGSLILMVVASIVLTTALGRIGTRLQFSESLLGIVTALGADAPEISSAVTALTGGHHDLGLGVVLGSNVFNLAALLGVSALVAGRVRVGRIGLLFDGGTALVITLIAAALLAGVIPGWFSLLLIVGLIVPYVWVSSLALHRIQEMTGLPSPVRRFLERAREETHDDSKTGETAPKATLFDALTLVPTLFAIVAASQGLVSSTIALATHYALPHAVAGTLGVAALTGIPNAIAAVGLARRGRGAAVVTETFNSNTLNVVAGVCLPAVIVGLGTVSSRSFFALWWLVGMSVVAVVLTAWRGGLGRLGGGLLMILYAVFATLIVLGGK